jgi:hypothetical protein
MSYLDGSAPGDPVGYMEVEPTLTLEDLGHTCENPKLRKFVARPEMYDKGTMNFIHLNLGEFYYICDCGDLWADTNK